MPVMSTILGRLGSRYSLTFDPHRRQVHYGVLGLHCQSPCGFVVALESDGAPVAALPFAPDLPSFDILEQEQSMTSLRFTGYSLALGVRASVRITAPFYPRNEAVSLVPAYVIDVMLESFDRVRWSGVHRNAPRAGTLVIRLDAPGAESAETSDAVRLTYTAALDSRFRSGEGGGDQTIGPWSRRVPTEGRGEDRLLALSPEFRVTDGALKMTFDVRNGTATHARCALIGWLGEALFERFGQPMRLKYTSLWNGPDDVAGFVRRKADELVAAGDAFDRLFSESDMPLDAQRTLALAFQSWLACSMWCVPDETADLERTPEQWFSVWEGSCWYNSTVDVTFNESAVYFSFWPELLELVFREWRDHAVTWEQEEARVRGAREQTGPHGEAGEPFPGRILEHDMGAGWTANGQSYHHAMPVEENSDFLILLYAHARWWNRPHLFAEFAGVCRDLCDYLFWSDSDGTGFPDRGTANTIDDASPAMQYGRENVYLGVKRMAALHAAARIFEAVGDSEYAERCRREVERAAARLEAAWQGDHYPVCATPEAGGVCDAWSGEEISDGELPGWDAHHIYTTNGLAPLFFIDDLPPGVDRERLRCDLVHAERACRTPYGSSHSETDRERVWISMNMWRDAAAGYLGVDFRHLAERYWNLQLFANGPGAEKPNGFCETTLANNLVLYPRGTAGFAWLFGWTGLVLDRAEGTVTLNPVCPGRFPLLPLSDWERGETPFVVVEQDERGKLTWRIEGDAGAMSVT